MSKETSGSGIELGYDTRSDNKIEYPKRLNIYRQKIWSTEKENIIIIRPPGAQNDQGSYRNYYRIDKTLRSEFIQFIGSYSCDKKNRIYSRKNSKSEYGS